MHDRSALEKPAAGCFESRPERLRLATPHHNPRWSSLSSPRRQGYPQEDEQKQEAPPVVATPAAAAPALGAAALLLSARPLLMRKETVLAISYRTVNPTDTVFPMSEQPVATFDSHGCSWRVTLSSPVGDQCLKDRRQLAVSLELLSGPPGEEESGSPETALVAAQACPHEEGACIRKPLTLLPLVGNEAQLTLPRSRPPPLFLQMTLSFRLSSRWISRRPARAPKTATLLLRRPPATGAAARRQRGARGAPRSASSL